MHASHLTAFVRAVTDGSLTRRSFARALAGVTMAAGLVADRPLLTSEAKKRKKRRKGKKRKRRGQSAGDDAGGGGTPCGGTLCNGQCVNLNTDPNNCGACGGTCPDDAVRVCWGSLPVRERERPVRQPHRDRHGRQRGRSRRRYRQRAGGPDLRRTVRQGRRSCGSHWSGGQHRLG